MVPTHVKIKPYKSLSLPVLGISRWAVTFGSRSVPVQWHIIQQDCEPILNGKAAEQLGIIKFSSKPEILYPLNMIKHVEKKKFNKLYMITKRIFKVLEN